MALKDMEPADFPLHFDKYSEVYDVLNNAASDFADLGYDDLSQEMQNVRAALSNAWDKITAAERAGR